MFGKTVYRIDPVTTDDVDTPSADVESLSDVSFILQDSIIVHCSSCYV